MTSLYTEILVLNTAGQDAVYILQVGADEDTGLHYLYESYGERIQRKLTTQLKETVGDWEHFYNLFESRVAEKLQQGYSLLPDNSRIDIPGMKTIAQLHAANKKNKKPKKIKAAPLESEHRRLSL